jgi:hypothetical protein
MACKEFHLRMKQLNNEQRTIVNDILYKKTKNSTIFFNIFLVGVLTQENLLLSHVLYKTYTILF